MGMVKLSLRSGILTPVPKEHWLDVVARRGTRRCARVQVLALMLGAPSFAIMHREKHYALQSCVTAHQQEPTSATSGLNLARTHAISRMTLLLPRVHRPRPWFDVR